ncbi:MAG TPA: glycosyltransferase, partial [Candidatus Sulfotelmatobacter sp.]|nr:glycosyltransferase [Candidatus Sulfotelmatobacter sp.]
PGCLHLAVAALAVLARLSPLASVGTPSIRSGSRFITLGGEDFSTGTLGIFTPALTELFTASAKGLPRNRFLLAGSQYPATLRWPRNVKRINHLSPRSHAAFYSSSRLTLNLTRADMVGWGYSPSVRLFEAAACGCPIVSDPWPGLGTVLRIGDEVLLAKDRKQVTGLLNDTDDAELKRIGERARLRVLEEHSASRRAEEFECYVSRAHDKDSPRPFTIAGTRASIVQQKEFESAI